MFGRIKRTNTKSESANQTNDCGGNCRTTKNSSSKSKSKTAKNCK